MSRNQGNKREPDESFDDRVAKIRRQLYGVPQKPVMELEAITDDDIREMFKISGAMISAQSSNYKPSVAMAADLAKSASIKSLAGAPAPIPPCTDLEAFPDPWHHEMYSDSNEEILSQELKDELKGASYATFTLSLDLQKRRLDYQIDGYDEAQSETASLTAPAWEHFGAGRLASLQQEIMDDFLEDFQLQNTVRARMYAECYFHKKRAVTKGKKPDYKFYQLSDVFAKLPFLLLTFDDPAPKFLGHEAEKAET